MGSCRVGGGGLVVMVDGDVCELMVMVVDGCGLVVIVV